VTPIEILCIIDHLTINLRKTDLLALRQRLGKVDRNASPNQVCPLIVDGACIIYPVRPINCRFYHSLCAADCEMVLADHQQKIRMRHDLSGMGLGVFTGIIEGLRSVGFQTRLLKLDSGLRVALDEPVRMRRWMAGFPAFADAEIDNANDIERFYRTVAEKFGGNFD
jgi:hypothetical protein